MRSALLGLLLLAATPALARAPEGLAPDPDRATWFASQVIPGTNLTCCNESDGRVVSYRIKDGHWEVYLEHKLWPDVIAKGTDHWAPVPDNTVLQHQPNPTGGAVVWISPSHWQPEGHDFQPGEILCFAAPAQG